MAYRKDIDALKAKYATMSQIELRRQLVLFAGSGTHSPEYKATRELIEEMELTVADAKHQELISRLDSLKRPHWTVTPNFILTLVAAVAAVVGAWLTWQALHREDAPRPVPALSQKEPAPQPPQPVRLKEPEPAATLLQLTPAPADTQPTHQGKAGEQADKKGE